jgi:methionine-S-sulfoxide reductase
MKLISFLLLVLLIPSIGFSNVKSVYFAGGCFWCVEEAFEKIKGVKEVYSGYSGGHIDNPSYEEVVKGDTGHIEAVKIDYYSDIIDTKDLLKSLFLNIDPFDEGGQFCDRGYSYRSAIFSNDEKLINKTKLLISNIENNHKKKVEFLILPYKNFYTAEDYHQDYYKKNPLRYNYYKFSCGREQRIKQLKVNLG